MAIFPLRVATWRKSSDETHPLASIAKGVIEGRRPRPVHVQNREAVVGKASRPILERVLTQPHDARVPDAVFVAAKKDVHAVVHSCDVHEVAVAVGGSVIAVFMGGGGLGLGHEMRTVGRKVRPQDVPFEQRVGGWPNAQEMRERVFFSLPPSLG